MSNRLMMSVAAAALIAGSGFVYAQGAGSAGSTSGGSTAQQSGSSGGSTAQQGGSSGGSTAQQSGPSGMKASQSEQKGAGSGQHAEEKDKMGQKSKSMSSDEKSGASKDMKAEGQKDRSGTMNAEGQKDRSGNMNAEGQKDRSGTMNAEGQRDRSSTSTTGQAGAGGARISVEQRTRITNIIRQQHVQPLTNVNFEIRTGARVPRDVRFHPLPQEIVTIYPQWRGYEYVLVKEQIVVIDPKTLEIVDVIDV